MEDKLKHFFASLFHCCIILLVCLPGISKADGKYWSIPELEQTSNLIVYGKVISAPDYQSTEMYASAKIKVQSVVKGKFKAEHIEIKVTMGLACPTPAHYETGKYALCFLSSEGVIRKTYTTSGMSSGVLYYPPQEFLRVESFYKELVDIGKLTSETEQKLRYFDWHIDMFPIDPNREIIGLSLESIIPYRTTSQNEIKYSLSSEVKSRIKKALYTVDSLGNADIALFYIVGDESDLPFIASKLNINKKEVPYYEEWRMYLFTNLADDKYLEEISLRFHCANCKNKLSELEYYKVFCKHVVSTYPDWFKSGP